MDVNLKIKCIKFVKDIHAESQVVATLILIMVIIVGVSGLGVIAGQFMDFEEQEPNIVISGRTIIIAGSTTVAPIVRDLADAFMSIGSGAKIVVQEGNSYAGVAAVTSYIVDIGMASRDVSIDELADEPLLQTIKIGHSEVVIIYRVNDDKPSNNERAGITKEDLICLFKDHRFTSRLTWGTGGGAGVGDTTNTREVFQRIDTPDTEFALIKALGINKINNSIKEFASDAEIRDAVLNSQKNLAIGFVNYKYAFCKNDTLKDSEITNMSVTCFNIPFNLITLDTPNDFEHAFLNFIKFPNHYALFDKYKIRPITKSVPLANINITAKSNNNIFYVNHTRGNTIPNAFYDKNRRYGLNDTSIRLDTEDWENMQVRINNYIITERLKGGGDLRRFTPANLKNDKTKYNSHPISNESTTFKQGDCLKFETEGVHANQTLRLNDTITVIYVPTGKILAEHTVA